MAVTVRAAEPLYGLIHCGTSVPKRLEPCAQAGVPQSEVECPRYAAIRERGAEFGSAGVGEGLCLGIHV